MKQDKNIEKFTKYIIKEAQIESPSKNFVNKVMDAVKLENELSAIKIDKPLISKPIWVLIIVAFAVSCIFILTGFSQSTTIFSKINFTFLDEIPTVNLFESIHFSNTFTFSFMFFSILVLFQLFAIKNYFNRQNAV
jgi:hypothetical protein